MNAALLQAIAQYQSDFEKWQADLRQLNDNVQKMMDEIIKLSDRCVPDNRNELLSVRQVLKELGLRRDDKAWSEIKSILIGQYGMTRIGSKSGLRIPRKKLNDFVLEKFK